MALPLMDVSVGQFRCETCGRDGLTTGGVCLRCVPTVDGAPAQYRDVRAVPVALGFDGDTVHGLNRKRPFYVGEVQW